MDEFLKWFDTIYHSEGTFAAVKKLLNVYDMSPEVERKDNIRAAANAYEILQKKVQEPSTVESSDGSSEFWHKYLEDKFEHKFYERVVNFPMTAEELLEDLQTVGFRTYEESLYFTKRLSKLQRLAKIDKASFVRTLIGILINSVSGIPQLDLILEVILWGKECGHLEIGPRVVTNTYIPKISEDKDFAEGNRLVFISEPQASFIKDFDVRCKADCFKIITDKLNNALNMDLTDEPIQISGGPAELSKTLLICLGQPQVYTKRFANTLMRANKALSKQNFIYVALGIVLSVMNASNEMVVRNAFDIIIWWAIMQQGIPVRMQEKFDLSVKTDGDYKSLMDLGHANFIADGVFLPL